MLNCYYQFDNFMIICYKQFYNEMIIYCRANYALCSKVNGGWHRDVWHETVQLIQEKSKSKLKLKLKLFILLS